jgi:hypothetical protein
MTVHVDDEDGVVVTADITNNYNNGTQQPQQQQQQHNHHQQEPVGNVRPTGNGLSKNVRVEDESGSVQFTSIVSASFLVVHCPNWMSCDLISLVDQLHKVSVNPEIN